MTAGSRASHSEGTRLRGRSSADLRARLARSLDHVTPRVLFLVILALAALLRLVHFAWAGADPYTGHRVGDELHYHEWAHAIAGGQLTRGAPFFTSPLYAYLLAGIYRVAGDALWLLRSLNLALGLGTVALTYAIARRTCDPWTAMFAPLLCGLCLPPLFYESLPAKTALMVFLTAASLHGILRCTDLDRPRDWGLAGLVLGVAALCHPLLLALLPAAWLHGLRSRWGERGRVVGLLAALTAGCLAGIAPATLHNYAVAGDPALVATAGGATFYIGNHLGNETGTYASVPFADANIGGEEHGFKAEAERRLGRRLGSSEVSRYWFGQGWREVAADPARALRRYWLKLRWTLGRREVGDSRTYEFYQGRLPVLGLPLWGFGLVSLLGLLGAALSARNPRSTVLVAFVAAYSAGLALFLVYGRYRLPLLVPLAALAAPTLAHVRRVVRAPGRRTAAFALTALPVAWLVLSDPLPALRVTFFIDHYNQGNKYWASGQPDRALEEYERALRVRPDHGRLLEVLARRHHQRGNHARAWELRRRAATLATRARALEGRRP